ncbi:membrane protein-like protein [Alkaliphilus metalliredigens QYMF]|uniref:Membrane protein-like protein n=1 Tax=Alkaliphilus metalliredigens (strain QYMF) TaxID=293826 RepID=A6TXB9_ALKMQ|nr:YybS family protein [Alkaliphilus metalliredigens]ABR50837.1 membrane protein-like protein [Alkaliphilus metalliredigens QYMF]
MNNVTSKKALIESALIASITAFFGIVGVYIPVLSVLLVLLPVPFMVLAVRHSTRYAALSLLLTSLLIGFLTSLLYPLFILLLVGPLALLMGYYIKRNREPFQVMALGSGASIISIFIAIQIISLVSGFNVMSQVNLMLPEVLEHQMDMLREMNFSRVAITEAFNYMVMILPGLMMIQVFIGAFINYYLTISILRRFRVETYELPSFSHFKLPHNIVLGTFIIFVLSLLTTYIEGIYHTSLIANVTLLFVFIFFLQGISFVSYLIKKTRINRTVRIIIIVLIVLISPLLTVVSIMGVIDAMLDIRKLRKS